MTSSPNIAEVASLIADPSRLAILVSLLGGKALPASELARTARITPQTASSHLAKMVKGGLLIHESYGRHKYFRLANSDVGHALEALQTIAPPRPVRSLRESEQVKALRIARTCYDHLAGKLGCALTDRLLELRCIEKSGNKDFILSAEGKKRLQELGVEIEGSPTRRRYFARQCLDWSERRHHLAGSLGSALTSRLFKLGWIEYLPDGRAVRVTDTGIKGLFDEFGLLLEI
ncbi:winged helix-turn-helix domain-containing protein [Paenibacillus sp. sptzw28]|uniref:ArsR/SmtB family transcription factor n=1 Tax=Paenibacillus sp. sptzw28 TaxID=715179 RepID=UPI001C6EA671|nr:winged helix-turn-helix domain-containing protein [Paenibacillus sp. sptzw28]QYR21773.1 winged helix-turn-helix domain-containing protein [Paenibacillus sp. sptzw28]